MLNDVKPPPREPPADQPAPGTEARPHNAAVKPHGHIQPHIDPKEPGLHHARIMGEKTPTDAIYAMPMEDRGSTFSVGLSIVVIVVFTVLLVAVWIAIR